MRYFNFLLVVLMAVLLVFSCKTDEEVVVVEDNFDRTAFLTNYADNFIIPAFDTLLSEYANYKLVLEGFENDLSAEKLLELRQAWTALYYRWQHLSSFNFGPAGSFGLRRTMYEEQGAFPVDTARIESRIASGDYLLEDSFRKTRGLCSVQYLLFKELDPQQCLEGFDTNRLAYLVAISNLFEDFMQNVREEWKASYRETFIANLKTNVTSSTTQMYNGFLMDFFRISNYKMATSLGLTSKQEEVDPYLLDVFYSKQSGAFIRYQFEVLIDLFEGESKGAPNQIGWADYIAMSNSAGEELTINIREKTEAVRVAFDALPTDVSLEELVEEEDQLAIDLNYALADLYRLFESDMSSILGLAVTFDIDDGD